MYGGTLFLKNGVVPHKFECQPNRTSTSFELNRIAYGKLNRKRVVAEMIRESNGQSQKENDSPNLSASNQSNNDQLINSEIHDNNESAESSVMKFGEESSSLGELKSPKRFKSLGIQARASTFVHLRSKAVLCRPDSSNVSCLARPETKNAATLPKLPSISSLISQASSIGSDPSARDSASSYVPSSQSESSSLDNEKKIIHEEMMPLTVKITLHYLRFAAMSLTHKCEPRII